MCLCKSISVLSDIVKIMLWRWGAGRAPSPAPEDQSAQVRAVSWLVLVVKRQHGCYHQEEEPQEKNLKEEHLYSLTHVLNTYTD